MKTNIVIIIVYYSILTFHANPQPAYLCLFGLNAYITLLFNTYLSFGDICVCVGWLWQQTFPWIGWSMYDPICACLACLSTFVSMFAFCLELFLC